MRPTNSTQKLLGSKSHLSHPNELRISGFWSSRGCRNPCQKVLLSVGCRYWFLFGSFGHSPREGVWMSLSSPMVVCLLQRFLDGIIGSKSLVKGFNNLQIMSLLPRGVWSRRPNDQKACPSLVQRQRCSANLESRARQSSSHCWIRAAS